MSASSIATSPTSGISRPSLKRLIPTRTSNSPILSCLISSVLSRPSISETERRRKKQILHNQKHGITPKTIVKAVAKREDDAGINVEIKSMSTKDLSRLAIEIEANMKRYAEDLDFEKAIQLRDQLTKIRKVLDSQIVEAPSR